MYVWKRITWTQDFAAYYQKNVDGNPRIGLATGPFDVPLDFLSETAIHTYEKTHTECRCPLKLPGYVWLTA